MADSHRSIEKIRLEEARHLPGTCYDDFLRLTRSLLHGPRFQWVLVEAPHEGLRSQVKAALDKVLHRAGIGTNLLPLSEKIEDVPMLENRLLKNARQAPVVHVIGGAGWFDPQRWEVFNIRRERLTAEPRARMVFWLDSDSISLASRHAPDLWAWRSGVYSFLPVAQPASVLAMGGAPSPPNSFPGEERPNNRSMAERSRRVKEIKAWLKAHPDAHDELKIGAFDELGLLLFRLSDFDGALDHWQRVELPFHRRRDDARAVAMTQERIADVLKVRGQLKEALRIYEEKAKPTFEQLGLVRLEALTMRKIADVYEELGQPEEALKILKEDLLPVYERLGDQRAIAVTMGKIADIMQARGQMSEALLIRQKEQLPTYKRLGDLHSVAVTMGKIADIMQARGQLSEALLIRQKEQLPAFEELGDRHSTAITMGKIAEILMARGQWYAALEIRQNIELPVYEREGDLRAAAHTYIKIVEILLASDEAAEADRIYQEKARQTFELLDDDHSKTVAYRKMAEIYQSYGRLDQALKIGQQEDIASANAWATCFSSF
jgi:tetratricopeptide (TPR) repeat protein